MELSGKHYGKVKMNVLDKLRKRDVGVNSYRMGNMKNESEKLMWKMLNSKKDKIGIFENL